jgi:endoglucanase
MYVELHDSKFINDKVFENAEWFYKVSRDPEIRDEKYDNNWQNFDYVVLTHEMLKQINKFDESDIVKKAFSNALPIVKIVENTTSFIDEQKEISTNGDWSMVYDVSSLTGVQLEESWNLYKKNFIHSYGQVIDPSTGFTTSEGQSYAMLRAVWMNDKETFKGVWLWTQHHMQHRIEDKLLSWKWEKDSLADATNATDADIDIALALLFAHKTFGDEQYLADAKAIINDIWDKTVINAGGRYHVLSASYKESQVPTGVLFNPSYMSPAHFRIFAEVDSSHDWVQLADDTYKTINILKSQYQTPLVKNWYVLDPETGRFSSARESVGASADHFSYDAFRIFWRVWLDYAWFNNQNAETNLTVSGKYLDKYAEYKEMPTTIDPVSGAHLEYGKSHAIEASYALPLSFVTDDQVARTYFARKVEKEYNAEGYWRSPDVYYDQNWVWFISAFYNNDLYNIWQLQ